MGLERLKFWESTGRNLRGEHQKTRIKSHESRIGDSFEMGCTPCHANSNEKEMMEVGIGLILGETPIVLSLTVVMISHDRSRIAPDT